MNEVHIPTVGGQIDVIGINIPTENIYKEYIAKLTQAGVADPTAVVIKNDFEAPIVWTRGGAGVYSGTLIGAFTEGTTPFISQEEPAQMASIKRKDADSIQIGTFDMAGTAKDDYLNSSSVEISAKQPDLTGNYEAIFDSIISGLDTNQLGLWKKIVIRNNSVVTEVDGATYRRTLNFATSSKTIES